MKGIIEFFKNYIKEKKRIYKRDRDDKKRFKAEKKKEKKFDKELDKEVKALEKERKLKRKEIPWYQRVYDAVVDFWKDMTDTQDEKELLALMTESERKNYDDDKKMNKIFTISGVGALAIIIIVLGTVFGVFREATKTVLESKIIPNMDTIFEERINSNDKIDEVNYLYTGKGKDAEKTDVVLATYTNGVHMMSIGDSTYGSDATISGVYDEYLNFIKERFYNVNLYNTNSLIMYNPYVVDYNYYYDYIDVLPIDKSFNDLYNESSLTIRDVISYEGDLDLGVVSNILSLLGDNSVYYLLQMNGDKLFRLTIMTKFETKSYSVTSYKTVNGLMDYFELDKGINNISAVNVSSFSNLLSEDYTSQLINVRGLKPITGKKLGKEDDRTSYYAVRMKDGLNNNDYIFLGKDKLDELQIERYPDVAFLRTSNGTFVIADKEIIIANKVAYESPWYCRFGLCKREMGE